MSAAPTHARILAIILAGGAGSRLELLTQHRAKAVVPYAGSVRLIDFALSNCEHAGISDVWVTQQFHPASIARHVSNGRPWDLDRTRGGLQLVPPHRGTDRAGWHSGTADSLWRQAPLIRQLDPRVLLVLSADAVYRQDYARLVDEHLESGAEVTMTTTEAAKDDAGRYGVVQTADDGTVTDYAYKPAEPASTAVTTEVFAFSAAPVLDRLEALAAEHDDLEDLGNHLLPALVRDGVARATAFRDYWRDAGTVPAYWASHQDLVAEDPPFRLDDPGWPVHTREGAAAPAAVGASARLSRSLLAPSAHVLGEVEGSVVGRGAVVERGASVVDSVLLPGVRVRAGARVVRAVLDDDVEVGTDAQLGAAGGDITLVGDATRLPAGAVLPAGARAPERWPDED